MGASRLRNVAPTHAVRCYRPRRDEEPNVGSRLRGGTETAEAWSDLPTRRPRLERLRRRGWVDADGLATAAGVAGRADVEATTDRLDSFHWSAIGDKAADALLADMAPINAVLPKDDQLDWRELYPAND